MRVLKFAMAGGEPPDIYYKTEVLKLHAGQDYEIKYKQTFIENLRLRAFAGSRYNLSASESLGLKTSIASYESLLESLGLTDEQFQQGLGDFVESLGLSDTVSARRVISISLQENIALADSGTSSVNLVDYLLTWRTRTRDPYVGYGKAGYGIELGYGDGVVNDIVSFRVKVYDSDTNILKRTIDISIVDSSNPDNDATYTYTALMNLSDHGWQFYNKIRFEVYQIDRLGAISPVASIDVEPIPF